MQKEKDTTVEERTFQKEKLWSDKNTSHWNNELVWKDCI